MSAKALVQRLNSFWSKKNYYDQLIIISSVVFLGIIAYFLALHRIFLTPDVFFVLAFIFVLFTGHVKSFLWDWTPLLLLILAYEFLRGLIPMVNHTVHYYLMPRFDLFVFGHIPSQVLQTAFFDANHLHWFDYTAVILYLSHFIIPLLTAFVFWQTDRKYFREFALSIVGVSYLTFLTYLAFPAAPPWMAAQMGIIPPVAHITDVIVSHLFGGINLFTVYRYVGANLTAAVPSLHAAYPLLTALFIGAKKPKLIPILVIYVLGVWLAVIYLGEHYFFDVVLGAVYALMIYAAIERLKKVPKYAKLEAYGIQR